MAVPPWKTAVAHYSRIIQSLSSKVCVGAILYRVVNEKITRSSRGIARKSDILGAETSRQESQVLAVGQTARVLVLLGTVLACLPVFKVDLGTVLSFCGMGGLAISLLSKGVFVNLIGSLTIYLTQPFTIGDWIQTVDGEVDGWVQSMGPYHTVVMRWDRRPLYIPNSRFMQVQIINANRMTNRRILLEIPVRLADLDKIDVVLEGIRDLITNHKDLDTEQHRLGHLRDITRYAAMIWVSCYTKGIKLKDFVSAREDILLGIKNIMFQNGMTFATTLEREFRRVDQTGRILSAQPGPPVGAPAEFAGTLPLGAPSEDEVLRRPQPLVAAQKQLLNTELQILKQKQEAIWVREKELKEAESSRQHGQERLRKSEEDLRERQGFIEQQTSLLDETLTMLAVQEEDLQKEEEEIDLKIDGLQSREDALDKVMRELRTKSIAAQSDELKDSEEDQQRSREYSFEQDQSFLNAKQEHLSKSKKLIEQEREILKEQKAEILELEEGEDGQTEKEDGDEQDEEQVREEELDEAARYKQIAESLGGE
uniref:Mechanosensitive ion channel MscS domain-containing protein n=1 Tax=Alexandrium catenella TaxID=2925 RepID=A0A7S1RXD4_ALECA